jgi:excisionase family DNA binding protein
MTNTPVNPQKLLDKTEAAKYLGLSVRTVDYYIQKRLLPFYKIGGKTVRFRLSDLDAALEKFRIA